MENTRETEVARRWLLSDPASLTYRYCREVTREIIAETKSVSARGSWTRREAVVFLLADRLQTDIAADSALLVSDVGIYQELLRIMLRSILNRLVASTACGMLAGSRMR